MSARMSIGWLDALIGGVVGLITAGAGLLLKRRLSSGTVDTSDAQTLWAEASAHRKAIMDENVTLRQRITELEGLLAAERRGGRK